MDETRREVIQKVEKYVRGVFQGSYNAAFEDFDRDDDGKIVHAELVELLKAAEVGSRLTRGAYARGVMDALDTDNDGAITWEEFEKALAAN